MLQVVNLSETILFQFNFPCFNLKNPPEAKYQWFLDDVIPRGVSIDILDDPHSSKLPLGTGQGIPFIGTPKTMADKHLLFSQKEYFGYTNLSERWIYGSQPLFQKYQANKRQLFKSIDKEKLIQTYNEVMRDYSKTVRRSWDNKIDIKNTFYRPLTLALETLSDLFHIDCVSSLDRINELQMQEVITESEALDLTEYLTKALKTRLSLHLRRGGQYEGADPEELPEIAILVASKEKSERTFRRLERALRQKEGHLK